MSKYSIGQRLKFRRGSQTPPELSFLWMNMTSEVQYYSLYRHPEENLYLESKNLNSEL